jgi:hypothetical protein
MPDEGRGVRPDLQPSFYHSIPARGLKTQSAEPMTLV